MALYFCFFNDTATTDIYTFLHTLALHAAPPISRMSPIIGLWPPCSAIPEAAPNTAACASAAMAMPVLCAPSPTACPPCSAPCPAPRRSTTRTAMPNRTEEHTSELQSLMRNSYAVFGLKKKTTQSNRQQKL